MSEILRTEMRLPMDVAKWLKAEAKAQRRSMNSQLVEILVQQMESRQHGQQGVVAR